MEGPFLISAINSSQKISFKRLNRPFVEISLRNLLNTTVLNTIYGILDGILAYSNYNIQVNASNSRGYLLTNRVKVETFKSGPSELLSPEFVTSTSTSIKLEWFEPILINSNDPTIFYKMDYKIKLLWNLNGTIDSPQYNSTIITLFSTPTLITQYTLKNLQPYTAYTFQLTAFNSFGECKSEWTRDFYTQEEIPRRQNPPLVSNFTSKSAFLKWEACSIPNGIITNFIINGFELKPYLYKSLRV